MQTEIEISCLPRNLPEFLEVDLSELELDKMLYLDDIKVQDGIEIMDLTHGNNQPVLAIHRPAKEEEPEEDEEIAGGEVPTVGDTDAKKEGEDDDS